MAESSPKRPKGVIVDMESFSALLLFGGFGAGAWVLGWQAYMFLRFGDWIGVSAITGLQEIGMAWAIYPTTWLGLYKVLDWVNLGVAIWVCTLVVAFTVAKVVAD